MKIEYRSRKRSHKLDGIGVGRIRTFPFLPIPFTTPSLMIQWKLGCRSRKQKRKTQPITRPGIELFHWFILPLLLTTPTMQFSLDRKRRSHKQNQCSASDSVGLIFTRSYRSTLLITTPTTTPSLVKTSLNRVTLLSLSPNRDLKKFRLCDLCVAGAVLYQWAIKATWERSYPG